MPEPNPPWLVCLRQRTHARVRLVCLPYAGGGASAFSPWADDLGSEVEVWAAQLPGRERRFAEPAATSVHQVVPFLTAAINGRIEPPWFLFGHSMGALLAWEIAAGLRAVPPAALFVSGAQAPHRPAAGDAHTFDDGRLVEWLRTLGGLPAEILADTALLRLLLAPVRADLELCGSYRYRPRPALAVPVIALAGTDDPLVTTEDMSAWAAYTDAGFDIVPVPGDHFFLHHNRRHVTSVIGRWVSAATAGWRHDEEFTRP